MNHLEEKVTIIERVQIENRDELKKDFEDLKEQTKKAENDLEEQIRQVYQLLYSSTTYNLVLKYFILFCCSLFNYARENFFFRWTTSLAVT